MKLKPHQEKAISKLENFIDEVQSGKSESEILGKPYFELKKDLPYLCIQVPTGGGKTIIASASLKQIIQNYLNSDFHTVFWLAPSETIVSQTLKALKDRFHPYREILEKDFQVDINPLSIREALKNRFETESLNIVVATIQTFRTSSKDGRKFTEENGFLGNISLSDYFKKEKPIIILDESHKSNTKLSFDKLLELDPSFILEFTATPNMEHQPKIGKFGSNILYSVKAEVLKNEKMINLPIYIRTITDYMQTLKDTISKQKYLENLAKSEIEYIRPIALIRAEENRNETSLNFEKIYNILVDDFQVPKEYIAIHTGNREDLKGKNLKSPDCQIRFIITIDKLKEGWDCPFAYILSVVSNMNSKVSIEQLLGRVLRNPYISTKKSKELNFSYVFAFSDSFETVANSVSNSLINDGFNSDEVVNHIIDSSNTSSEQLSGLLQDDFLEEVEISENFNLDNFQNANLEDFYNFNIETKKMTMLRTPLKHMLPRIENLGIKIIKPKNMSNKVFRIPKAQIESFDFEESVIFENFEIDREKFLSEANIYFSKENFLIESKFDIKSGKIQEVGKRAYSTLSLFENDNSDKSILQNLAKRISLSIQIKFLDYQIIFEFVNIVLKNIRIPPHLLVSQEYRISKDIKQKIIEIVNSSKQTFFKDKIKSLFTDKENVFEISCQNYQGLESHNYAKHFCNQIESMNSEEKILAEQIDMKQNVKRWLKNGVSFQNSFWLQMAKAKFYPDFIIELTDGKIVVLEYKGKNMVSNDETMDKEKIGNAWANSSSNLEFYIIQKSNIFQIMENF